MYKSFVAFLFVVAIASNSNAQTGWVDTSGHTVHNGTVGVNTTDNSGSIVAAGTQTQPRFVLAGSDYYSGVSSGGGVGLLLGVNVAGNRQLWIGDTTTLSTNNALFRIALVRDAANVPSVLLDAMALEATGGVPIIGARMMTIGSSSNLVLSATGGNVGIGTSNPVDRLSIQGGAISFYNPSNPAPYVGFDFDNTTDSLRVRANRGTSVLNTTMLTVHRPTGNVGIGTTANATWRLAVEGSDLTTYPGIPATMSLTDASPYSTANSGAGIRFNARYNSASQIATIGAVAAVKEINLDGNYAGALTFSTRLNGASAPSERMRIRSDGRVVVGIQDASVVGANDRMVVYGDMTVTGNIGAKYQDLAEWVPATTKMKAGTVVVLNPARNNEVMPSSTPYDTTIAGVVSEQPGLILGEGSDSKAKIATTGRVRVHVDATTHAIKIGDLLVTSSKSGMAMYSEPVNVGGVRMHRPGTLIGKALEPLPAGEGEILVLLSLQ